MLQSLVLSTLVAASGWMVPTAPGAVCGARGCLAAGPMLARCQRSVCMQEGQGPAAAATEPVSDFTEDLLDALATDEPALAEEPAVFHKGSGEVSLEPLPSYTNMRSVEEMRSKYMLHENDTGSSQVQIASRMAGRRLGTRCEPAPKQLRTRCEPAPNQFTAFS